MRCDRTEKQTHRPKYCNPRCACAPRVNNAHALIFRLENAVTYPTGNEGQNICGDLPETTAFKSCRETANNANYSDLPTVSFLRLTHSEASEGYPTIVNNIQPCPKLCLLMPLARVGARTDSTTSLQLQREAWPTSAHAHWGSRQDAVFCAEGFAL